MAAETISFRLTTLALAKGLVAIRNLEPNYQPKSIHKMVQLVYYDYCSKMSIGHSSEIPIEIFNEIDRLLPGNRKKSSIGGDEEILNKLGMLKETSQLAPTQDVKPAPTLDNPRPAVWINKSADNDNELVDIDNDLNTLCDDVESDSESTSVKDFSFLKDLGGNNE